MKGPVGHGSLAFFLGVLSACCAARGADVHATLADAQKQYEQAHFEQALKLYQQADQAEPGHAAVEYNIALCHLNLGDNEKAAQHFESVASQRGVNKTLRRDAFYNIGLMRAEAAHKQLKDLFAPATQPSDHKPAPGDPANIEKLQSVAEELLRAIGGFRKSAEVEPGEDTEHNIRAARIMRRDVLGLLRKAHEARQKDDMLKDPRAYLEALILAQAQQVSLTRLLLLNPPGDAAAAREARRAGLRGQRKIMENTGEFADNLIQFHESGKNSQPGAPAWAPASQPAEETPREKIYRAAAKQLKAAIDAQRDVSAFLLDNEMKQAHEKGSAARDEMYKALYMFPLDPGQVLVKARLEQAQLRQLVGAIKDAPDWLRDPLLAEAPIPKDVKWEADKTPIHFSQSQVGQALAMLHRQCQYVATTSRPADEPAQPPQQEKEPMVDPELNRKLAEVLVKADPIEKTCLDAIVAQDGKASLAAQEELLKLIDAALELLPKTLEQRITELIVRQGRLNSEVQAEAGRTEAAPTNAAGAALDEARKWATRFKSKLLGAKPSKLADTMSTKQQGIRTDTMAVNDEVRQKVPAGADPGASAGQPPAASQPAELKAFIEAAKHLTEASGHMEKALKGFEQAIVEDSLQPMQPDGPVQVGQKSALEELIKALAALKPPATQPNQDQDQQKEQKQQQEQQQEKDQDKQREVDRMEKERERAERELYQRRPRTVIKDW